MLAWWFESCVEGGREEGKGSGRHQKSPFKPCLLGGLSSVLRQGGKKEGEERGKGLSWHQTGLLKSLLACLSSVLKKGRKEERKGGGRHHKSLLNPCLVPCLFEF